MTERKITNPLTWFAQFCHRLHLRLGDLWWYSLMIFCAARTGDVIQAVIGLWLVPKYVSGAELGVVIPLQNMCTFIAAPLLVLATVFIKQINTYSIHEDYGKIKALIRDTYCTLLIAFIFCIVLALLLFPNFFVRLRIAKGLLGLLVLATALSSNFLMLTQAILQGLKKFKVLSLINILGAPIRLIVLLIAMPIRALSGYILGQGLPPALQTILALFLVQKDLKKIPFDKSWRKDIPSMFRYAQGVAVWILGGAFVGAFAATLFRQRLPEVESAAYYMLTKLAEIAGFVGLSITTVLFPFVSEAHERNEDARPLLKKALLATCGIGLALTALFACFGTFLFRLIPTYQPYLAFAGLLPITTLRITLTTTVGVYLNYELACRRYGAVLAIVGLNLLYCIYLPFLLTPRMGWNTVHGVMWINLLSTLIEIAVVFYHLFHQRKVS